MKHITGRNEASKVRSLLPVCCQSQRLPVDKDFPNLMYPESVIEGTLATNGSLRGKPKLARLTARATKSLQFPLLYLCSTTF